MALGAHHHLDGLQPITALLVVRRQRLHRRHVAGIECEAPQQARLGPFGIAELGGLDAAHPAVELRLAGIVELDETTEHVDRAVPGADVVVQPGECVECAGFAAIQAQRVGVRLDRGLDIVQLGLVGLPHRDVQLDLRRDVGHRRDVVAIGLDECFGVTGLPVQARQQVVRGVVTRVEREHLLVRIGGAIEVAESLLPSDRDAFVDRRAVRVGSRCDELGLERLDVAVVLRAPVVESLESAQRGETGRLELACSFVRRDRLASVGYALFPDRADLEPRTNALGLVRR